MTTTLTIAGMRSVYSKRAVFTALAGVGGVQRADVAMGRAVVEHDGTVTEAELRDAVTLVGCTVTAVAHDRRTLPIA